MACRKQIHGHGLRFGLHQNPFISAALVNTYSHWGGLDTAEKVFISLPNRSVAAWNSLISAYVFHNIGSKTIETFIEMAGSGIPPTNGSSTSLLSACSHGGLVAKGCRSYDQMLHDYKVQPTAEHHACIVDILGQQGGSMTLTILSRVCPTNLIRESGEPC